MWPYAINVCGFFFFNFVFPIQCMAVHLTTLTKVPGSGRAIQLDQSVFVG